MAEEEEAPAEAPTRCCRRAASWRRRPVPAPPRASCLIWVMTNATLSRRRRRRRSRPHTAAALPSSLLDAVVQHQKTLFTHTHTHTLTHTHTHTLTHRREKKIMSERSSISAGRLGKTFSFFSISSSSSSWRLGDLFLSHGSMDSVRAKKRGVSFGCVVKNRTSLPFFSLVDVGRRRLRNPVESSSTRRP